MENSNQGRPGYREMSTTTHREERRVVRVRETSKPIAQPRTPALDRVEYSGTGRVAQPIAQPCRSETRYIRMEDVRQPITQPCRTETRYVRMEDVRQPTAQPCTAETRYIRMADSSQSNAPAGAADRPAEVRMNGDASHETEACLAGPTEEIRMLVPYVVEVATAERGTGRNYFAGTDDHVCIQIQGSEFTTEVITLSNDNAMGQDKKKNLFEAGQVDSFQFEAGHVGEVTSVFLTLKSKSRVRDDDWNPRLVTVYMPTEKVRYTTEECRQRLGSATVELKVDSTLHFSPLEVWAVDLNIPQNTMSHHTDAYDITRPPEDPEDHWAEPMLVVRRGQRFLITLKTARPCDAKMDCISVVLKAGKTPSPVEGTMVKLTGEMGEPSLLKPTEWGARIKNISDDQVILSIMPAADCPVGKWDINIVTRNVAEIDEKETFHIGQVYILYNAWCKDDAVYMADDDKRDEYVMNDHGRIFVGTVKNFCGRPWNFAQFEDVALDSALALLDKVKLKYRKRGSPVDVCRAVSAIVNCVENDGLMAGNWGDDFSGGTPPTKWPGSHSILKEFWRTKEIICFAQCWVFSGVCTTVCRALGIPTRPVTAFESAHDSDGSSTIDRVFFQGELQRMGAFFGDFQEYKDSIWNFHVWNESWMTRPDLPAGYGGWQAFDATPQEESPYNHIHCAGPASIKAIKEGNVNLPYDGRFIFSEVNADEVFWYFEDYETYSKTHKTKRVGRSISTQYPRKQRKNNLDERRLDVTNEYKHKEGSEEERKAVMRAALFSRRPDVYDEENLDVTFEVELDEKTVVGSNFDIIVKMTNHSKKPRNVTTTITVSSVRYNGLAVPAGKVVAGEIKKTLAPEKCEGAKMTVDVNKYLKFLTYDALFQIVVLSKIEETGQYDTDIISYKLRMPDIDIKLPETANVGDTITMDVAFTNPLPKPLTKCEMTIEGAGLQKPQNHTTGDIKAHGEWKFSVQLKPRKGGDQREIVVSFTSAELQDIQTSASMVVIEPIVRSVARLLY